MKKIKINMLSIADIIKGQGVETAYNELYYLLNKYGSNDFEIVKNGNTKCDILHMHTVNIGSYIKQRITKNKTLTYVHFLPDSIKGEIHLPKFCLDIYSWWVKKCYLKSDYLVVVNPTFIDEMVKLGFNKDNIFYIPNVVTNNIFKSLKNKNELRDKYNYSKDKFIVTSVGQLHKAKGVLDFASVAKSNPNMEFIWIGGFSFGKKMEGYKEIKKIYDNPPSNLHFTEVIDRDIINEYLNMSDVFFLPSYYESFALVALEAANTEIPIVLRDVDIYKGIYSDKVLYGKDNKDFSNIINKLSKDKEIYNKCIKNSKYIKNKYSEKTIYKEWEKLYKTIAK